MKTQSKAIIFGGLKEQPKLYKTQSGKSRVAFQVASKRYTGKEEVTDWLDVVAWGNNAEYIALYGQRWSQVLAYTYPVKRSYEKDGVNHWVTEFVCEDLKIVRGGAGKDNQAELPDVEHEVPEVDGEPIPDITQDDLPF